MPQMENKVVARFRDGTVAKGQTFDFNPNKEVFHITRAQEGKEVLEVRTSRLKAVFFVKTFAGDKNHPSSEDFSEESLKSTPGLKVKVTFFDGEVMYGSTNGYTPHRKGFFIFPAHREINNERVFVIKESTTTVETWR